MDKMISQEDEVKKLIRDGFSKETANMMVSLKYGGKGDCIAVSESEAEEIRRENTKLFAQEANPPGRAA